MYCCHCDQSQAKRVLKLVGTINKNIHTAVIIYSGVAESRPAFVCPVSSTVTCGGCGDGLCGKWLYVTFLWLRAWSDARHWHKHYVGLCRRGRKHVQVWHDEHDELLKSWYTFNFSHLETYRQRNSALDISLFRDCVTCKMIFHCVTSPTVGVSVFNTTIIYGVLELGIEIICNNDDDGDEMTMIL